MNEGGRGQSLSSQKEICFRHSWKADFIISVVNGFTASFIIKGTVRISFLSYGGLAQGGRGYNRMQPSPKTAAVYERWEAVFLHICLNRLWHEKCNQLRSHVECKGVTTKHSAPFEDA